ncbi:GNAT family N-acetyltransferase [Nitratidesulfovibrio sp.]|uniref:lipid II:glycine glycyltransferase FemX n=1 Tax=Nitratidesulfovibrio sp. TaxID=2802297 RepID=UPI00333E8C84
MHIETCGPDRFVAWDAFLDAHQRTPLFHSRQWLELLARHHSAALELGMFIDDAGDVAGLFPVFHRNYVLIRVFSSPYVVTDTPYLGPLMRDDVLTSDAWNAMVAYVKTLGMDFLRMFTTVDTRLSGVTGRHVGIARKTTHVLDLTQGLDAVWKGMEGRCRTAVRKAEKEGVRVTEATGQGFIDAYVDMLEAVYARQGLASPNSRAFYSDMWRTFGGGRVVGLAASHEGRDIAGALLVMDKRDAYYISGASREDGCNVSPNNILQWEAIRIAARQGIERYDFVGSDIPRLARFKKSFGGELMEYGCIEMAPSLLARVLRSVYPRLKRSVGRV